jgi:hypothetical protein
VRRGFDDRAIKAVLLNIPWKEPDNIIVRPRAEPGRVVIVLIGLMVSGLGLFLWLGNKSGLSPTLPYLGFVVMAAGGVIMALGRS